MDNVIYIRGGCHAGLFKKVTFKQSRKKWFASRGLSIPAVCTTCLRSKSVSGV